jgi:hypothetical protein
MQLNYSQYLVSSLLQAKALTLLLFTVWATKKPAVNTVATNTLMVMIFFISLSFVKASQIFASLEAQT